MKKGDQVYIKGPRGTYAASFGSEIGEIVEVCKNLYPDNPPGSRDLFRVALEPEAIDRCKGLAKLHDPDFWRLESATHLGLKGDKRFGILFYEKELDWPQ